MKRLFQQFSPQRIGFGAASLSGEGGGYGFGSMSEADGISLVHNAIERGVRVFDTAPIYGFGRSEEILGKALKKCRENVLIVSKAGVDWHSNRRVNMSNVPEVVERMFLESLERLKTNYIDLYMLHWPDNSVDVRDSLKPLIKFQQLGQLKHIGLSNTHREDLLKALELTEVAAVQAEYNMFNSQAFEGFEDILREHNIAVMSWGTFDKGILSGTVTKERRFEACDARSWAPWWKAKDPQAKIAKAEEFAKNFQAESLSLKQGALKFVLDNPLIDVALIGFKSIDQLDILPPLA